MLSKLYGSLGTPDYFHLPSASTSKRPKLRWKVLRKVCFKKDLEEEQEVLQSKGWAQITCMPVLQYDTEYCSLFCLKIGVLFHKPSVWNLRRTFLMVPHDGIFRHFHNTLGLQRRGFLISWQRLFLQRYYTHLSKPETFSTSRNFPHR